MTLAADGIVFGFLGKGFALDPGGSPNTALLVSGNQVTVRGNRLSNAQTCVQVDGDDAVVRDNSFSYCNGAGIQVAGANAQIRGNQIGFSGSAGVSLGATSSAAVVRENRIFGPTSNGVQIDGSGHRVQRNMIQGTAFGISSVGAPAGVHLVENVVSSLSLGYSLNVGSGWVLTRNAAIDCPAPGFYLSAGTAFTLTGNVAIGNASAGILLQGGSDHTLVDNTAIDTAGSGGGILLSSVGTGVTISGGNLYGNSDNCGLSNSSANPVTADGVYWGAATGPGLDPADNVCGNTAAVTVTDPASKPAVIKMPPLK
jgi:parallel beta-helix repeat protein